MRRVLGTLLLAAFAIAALIWFGFERGYEGTPSASGWPKPDNGDVLQNPPLPQGSIPNVTFARACHLIRALPAEEAGRAVFGSEGHLYLQGE
jgi:hypothetical protein